MNEQNVPVPADRRWPRWPETDEWSVQAVGGALLSGRLAVSGARSTWASRNVAAARALADRAGREHCVLTTSGSSAILVALQALGVGPGDVVLMPATTWVSCATSVLRVGATPAFYDADEESPCLVGETPIESPAVVLAIHLYAQHADVDALRARFPDSLIVEDASHSQLSLTADGRRIGGLGDVSIMSLQATKVLTSGEGGAVLTDDEEVAARAESLVMDSRRRAELPAESAANELEPAFLLHGANHSVSEVSAALLLDQLDRLPAQAALRSRAALRFVNRLAAEGWHCPSDDWALRSGNFYGLAVRVPDGSGTPEQVVARVAEATGLTLDRVYPPVPEGPLYRPGTVKQYSGIGHLAAPTKRSRQWHETHVVVPHHAFLALDDQLDALAAALTGASAPTRAVARRPSIEVVVVTKGDRPSLEAALAGVAAQRVDADVRVTVWWDGPAPRDHTAVLGRPELRVITVDTGRVLPEAPFERIAALRQLAAQTCDADYTAFLDDDNVWAPDHLASLLALASRDLPAVHSWRTLVGSDSRPVAVDRFPWLPPGREAVDRWRSLQRAGVVDAGGTVVRDDVRAGMVDMGAWLFDTRLLRLLRFSRPRTPDEVAARLGEDDVVLEQLDRLGVPTACTGLPSLRYRLGGMSNPEHAAI
ncbi:aminotransferase class I/II-fold pyridoxal phosphate-dependent enzyme [Umezawaea sp.]|uniref:aminotransferase class I/II-fold pyridoxal phosphate-dependent enzyme n=1 Tax=Umezawaea sp. TaxID=1955258 RepID=UPI002ED18799